MSIASLYLSSIEAELHRAVGLAPAHLGEYYAMLEYHLGWAEAGQNSGKRIRPLLCLLTCAACGAPAETALPMAAALELLHNFSLIHDDIQDNSPLRRGRPTVWAKWGQAQAINAGDAMFTLAHLAPHALTTPPATTLRALEIFDQTCLRLTQGQYLDMDFEQRRRVTVAEYLEMIEGKTAALIEACAQLGALVAHAPVEQMQAFATYGRALGLAFQAHDDWLGIWGDPAVTGKSAASDLEKRKKSLPVVFGLEHSKTFAQAYADRTTAPAELAQLLEDLGAHRYTTDRAATLTAEALASLDAAQPQGEAGAALRELTDQLLKRKS